MIRVSHECPVQLFEASNEFNDFDYALAPRVLDHKAYRDFYAGQSKKGRTVWLDTGVFEEGKPRSDDELIECINLINPTHMICPDVLHDAKATIEGVERFTSKFNNPSFQFVGVVQGSTPDEFLDCYFKLAYNPKIHTICLPYDVKFYDKYLDISSQKRFVLARQTIIDFLLARGVILEKKNHHLLGCSDPIEFKKYADRNNYGFITSIDTSSPVLHGIHGVRYTDEGLPCEKIKKLMVDSLDEKLNDKQLEDIKFNLNKFREFLGRGPL